MRLTELAISRLSPQSAWGSRYDSWRANGGRGAKQCLRRRAGRGRHGVARGVPRSHVAKVAARAEPVEQVDLSDALSGRANALRSWELSLKCVAAGARCWGRFREMTGRHHFSLSKEAAMARSAYSLTDRTP